MTETDADVEGVDVTVDDLEETRVDVALDVMLFDPVVLIVVVKERLADVDADDDNDEEPDDASVLVAVDVSDIVSVVDPDDVAEVVAVDVCVESRITFTMTECDVYRDSHTGESDGAENRTRLSSSPAFNSRLVLTVTST